MTVITSTNIGTRLKEHQKVVFFRQKENSGLSEHTFLTNDTIGWDNSNLIIINNNNNNS